MAERYGHLVDLLIYVLHWSDQQILKWDGQFLQVLPVSCLGAVVVDRLSKLLALRNDMNVCVQC